MKIGILAPCRLGSLLGWMLSVGVAQGQNPATNVYPIDLPSTLRLAGAQNLDIQLARERLKQAEAERSSALEQFFPWLSPGIGYHRRDGVAQAVPAGTISDAHFQSYSPGVTIAAQLNLGDAIYNTLAAKQLVKASDQGLEAQQQDAVLAAVRGYFELFKAQSLSSVAREALSTSRDYQQQLHEAVAAGIAFKGDELRVQTQSEHYELALRQNLEQQRIAAANLAQILHLDSRIELVPPQADIVPLQLLETNASANKLVEQALERRPELKQSQAYMAAARAGKNGAVYGPLIPSVGAQVFAGGLGGGPDGGPSNLGAEADYLVGLSWKIGPGGLFDAGRVNSSKARLSTAQLADSKLRDAIISEVVTSLTRMQSLGSQIELAKTNLGTATETLRLTRERRQYGVGVVLEDIQAQQDLNQARSQYFSLLADYNTAQYELRRAVGGMPERTGTKP